MTGYCRVSLFGFMVWRDGLRGTLSLFRGMGLVGVAVAACLAVCTSSFVVALGHTTVANILLIQAGTPLVAALLSFIFLGERISLSTWIAIFAVIFGVGVMVSDSLGSGTSLIGNGLAVLVLVGMVAVVGWVLASRPWRAPRRAWLATWPPAARCRAPALSEASSSGNRAAPPCHPAERRPSTHRRSPSC